MAVKVHYVTSYRAVSAEEGVEVTVEGQPLLLGHFPLQVGVLLLQSPGGVQGQERSQGGV